MNQDGAQRPLNQRLDIAQFHLAQILRAHATRSQVSSSFTLLSWGRAVRRTLKPVTPLEPLMESSPSAVTESINGSLSGFSGFLWIFRARKVQNFPASFSSSELSAHQMAPSGVIAHWRSPCGLQPIRAERSSNGSWRSHSALAESLRTRTSIKLHSSVAPTL